MSAHARVTVTLPAEVVRDIDRVEENRSKFVLEAVTRELSRRRRHELRRSLRAPHPEAAIVAETGFDEWAARWAGEPSSDLVDTSGGTPVSWVPGEGWVERGR